MPQNQLKTSSEDLTNSRINNTILIFSGSFKCENSFDIANFVDASDPDSFEYYQKIYYQSYLNNLIPNNHSSVSPAWLRLNKEKNEILKNNPTFNIQSILFSIEDVFIHLFEDIYGVFSIRIKLSKTSLTISDISNLINQFRGIVENKQANFHTESDNPIYYNTSNFIDQLIFNGSNQSINWQQFTPNLKTYLCVDLTCPPPSDEKELNDLLYDLGSVAPIGSAKGSGDNLIYQPSNDFYKHLINNHSISIFKNWKALCVLDTFTRISFNLWEHEKTHAMWEKEYFNLYAYCLFAKFYLFDINSTSTGINQKDRKRFLDYIAKYNLSHISYKFIQNKLYQKVMASLEIEQEFNQLEQKIERINTLYTEEEAEKKELESTITNAIGFIIALIGIISIWQALDGIINNGISNSEIKSLLIIVLLFSLGYGWIKRKRDAIKSKKHL